MGHLMRDEECLAIARETLDIEIEGIMAVRAALGQSFVQAVELLGRCRGRVIITGIGKSGLVGRKLAATLSSTGTAAFFMHPVEGQHGDLGSIRNGDVVIAISNSGNTDELNAILPVIRSFGVSIIALTGGLQSRMAALSDLVINTAVPREACPMNLAPTSSTTAVLAVGDALAVALIRYKNFTEQDFRVVHPGGSLGQRLRLSIDEIMRTENLPVLPDCTSSAQALDALNRGGLGTLVLECDGIVCGILTDGDIRRALCRGVYHPDVPVKDIMTVVFTSADSSMKAAEVLDIMERKGITALPVLDAERKLVGIVHMHDVLGKGTVSLADAQ